MILNKLYTQPKQIFKPIEFHNGLNIIYAHRDEEDDSDPKHSLHAVGKSTVLDFILFALLFDNLSSSPRLSNAYNKKILKGTSVVLQFSVDKKEYKITRSFDNPNKKIYFGPLDSPRPSYTVGKLSKKLFSLIFLRDNYNGFSNSYWYQKLLSFFIKVKRREDLFSDPIDFSRNLSTLEQAPFHFFLLNIDNSFPHEHKIFSDSIHKTESLINESEKILKEKSHTTNLTKLENKRTKLIKDIRKLEDRVEAFSLRDNYPDYEKRADELTVEIKKLWFQNAVDRKKLQDLKDYENSNPIRLNEKLDDIAHLYSQVDSLLAGNVKKTLKEAVAFRKSLFNSRKDFVTSERGSINSAILLRDQQIEKLETERKNIFDELSKLDALTELTDTYKHLSGLQHQLSDIDGTLKSIDNLKEDLTRKIDEHSDLLKDIDKYFESILPGVGDFKKLLLSVYENLFLDTHPVTIFDVSETDEKTKIQISLLEGSIMDSTGKNQCRTLIYDIAVLLNIISKNLNAPRFIAHDGIFENLDKSHFIAFLSYINSLIEKKYQFQYILTLNEHDFFDEIKDLKKHKIIANSVIQLTPSSKLLGEDF